MIDRDNLFLTPATSPKKILIAWIVCLQIIDGSKCSKMTRFSRQIATNKKCLSIFIFLIFSSNRNTHKECLSISIFLIFTSNCKIQNRLRKTSREKWLSFLVKLQCYITFSFPGFLNTDSILLVANKKTFHRFLFGFL